MSGGLTLSSTDDELVPLPADFADRFEQDERPACQLYVVSPPRIEIPAFTESLKAALDGGPVAAFQLRLKDVSDADVLRACAVYIETHEPPAGSLCVRCNKQITPGALKL